MHSVAVVIPVLNEAEHIGECLQHVLNQTLVPDEVIVVDNGSRDATAQIAQSLGATVVTESRRSSYAARNAGIEASSSPAIAFTDADCRPRRGWLENGLVALETSPVVGGQVIQTEGRTAVGRYDQKMYLDQAHAVKDLQYAATANLIVRRSVVASVGGFDARLMSGGDVDFCWRAIRSGFSVGYAADAVVDHLVRDGLAALVQRSWRLGAGHAELTRLYEEFASICPISIRRLRPSTYEQSILRGQRELMSRSVAESTMLISQTITTWRHQGGRRDRRLHTLEPDQPPSLHREDPQLVNRAPLQSCGEPGLGSDTPTSGRTTTLLAPWGHRLTVAADDRSHVPGFFATGMSWPHEINVLNRILQPGMHVVDCGAAFGYLTSLAAARVGPRGRVLAIEPDAVNVALLAENVRANGLDHVTVMRSAVSDRNGQASLWPSETHLACHSLQVDNVPNPGLAVSVTCATLATLMRRVGWDWVDFLKVDVEGHEARVLAGAGDILDCLSYLWMEFWPGGIAADGSDPEAVLSSLHASFTLEMHDLVTGQVRLNATPADVMHRCEGLKTEMDEASGLYPLVYILATARS